jgi:hypothetical protein
MKVQKTFTIDDDTYKEFSSLCKKLSINKSLFVENSIKKLLENNDINKENKNKHK